MSGGGRNKKKKKKFEEICKKVLTRGRWCGIIAKLSARGKLQAKAIAKISKKTSRNFQKPLDKAETM